jgi:hypothetical protein
MILSDRSEAHKHYIIEQFQAILPGFSNYRVKFGRGPGYAVMLFVDMRPYFSHDGKVFHLSPSSRTGVPYHSIEIQGYRP